MDFLRRSVFLAFVFVFLASANLYAFQNFTYTSDSATSIRISFELPPDTIAKLSAEKDVNSWRKLLGLSCKKSVGGECVPEASAIFEIPSGAGSPRILDAVGTTVDGTVLDCSGNVYQGTVGRWRNKNIATPHVRPLLVSASGEVEAFFVRVDFRLVWNGGDIIAKGKRLVVEARDQYFEDSYRDSIVNYGDFPSYASKGAKDIKDVPGLGSIDSGQKMYVVDRGIYRITYEDLKPRADFKVDELDPRTSLMSLAPLEAYDGKSP